MIATPAQLEPALAGKSVENIFFRKYLKQFSSAMLDEKVRRLNEEVSSAVDCTACANCCMQLEPGLDAADIEKLAPHRNMDAADFRQQYVAFDGDSLFLRTKPCMFLEGTVCSVYTDRPGACAAYPHLDQPDFKYKRNVWANYNSCPIVFNVVEALKQELGFAYQQ